MTGSRTCLGLLAGASTAALVTVLLMGRPAAVAPSPTPELTPRPTGLEHITNPAAPPGDLDLTTGQPQRQRPVNTPGSALAMYDDNGNGRISGAEARAHGIAPVERSHPAYEYMRDGDGDGVVCE